MSRLCWALDRKWEVDTQRQVVLFEWTQFLQYEALEYLGIRDSLDLTWFYVQSRPLARLSEHTDAAQSPSTGARRKLDPRAVQDNQLKKSLLDILRDYDASEKQAAFEKEGHTCNVCFSDKLGSQCIRFENCLHVFCKECTRSYFEIQIKDGSVKSLNCPEDKCDSQATPSQVRISIPQ